MGQTLKICLTDYSIYARRKERFYNEFRENAIKYAIYNSQGQKLTGGNVPKNGKVILGNDMYLEATGVATFTLLIWLDNTSYNQNSEMGKAITAKINIISKQIRY